MRDKYTALPTTNRQRLVQSPCFASKKAYKCMFHTTLKRLMYGHVPHQTQVEELANADRKSQEIRLSSKEKLGAYMMSAHNRTF
jgi:hypothetical protein